MTVNNDLLAQAKRDLATVYSYAGDLDRAEQYAKESFKHYTPNRIQVWGPVYKTLGDVMLRRGDFAGAIANYEDSLRWSSRGFEPLVKLSLANAMIAANKLDRAAALVDQAEAAGAKGALSWRIRATIALKLGKFDEARLAFQRSTETTNERDIAYNAFWAAEGVARTELVAGRRDEAIKAYLAAIAAAEQVRARFRSEEFKTGLFGNMQQVFDAAVDQLAQAGRVDEALEVSERGRSRALLDMVRGRLNSTSGDEFLDPLARRFIAADAVKTIRAGSAIIEYHVLQSRTYVWVLTREGVKMSTLPIGRADLTSEVDKGRDSIIRRSPNHRAILARIHDTILRSVLPEGIDQLVIVPHGPLHYLPFQALFDGSTFLIERTAISYTPSAGTLLAIQARNALPRKSLFALGNPDLGKDALRLPGAEREVNRIKDNFPGATVLFGAQASKRNFTKSAGGHDVLHVAAHAEADLIDPLHSFIRLATADAESGILEAREVYQLKLGGTSLVTLSACETGLGKVTNGDEIWGFTRSFLAAGASTLLASLWPVSDESTEALMSDFYAKLSGMGAAKALRSAQLLTMKDERFSHPFFWAAFNLSGEYE